MYKRLSNLFRVKDITSFVLKSINILVLVVVTAILGKLPAISALKFVSTRRIKFNQHFAFNTTV